MGASGGPLAGCRRKPDNERMRLGAIILAGGRSSRMGRPKAALPFAGDTLLGRTCAVLARCAQPIVVVARDAAQPLPDLPAGVARTHDARPDGGPLAGIAAGLAWLEGPGGLAPADAAFVVACDHPFLAEAVVRQLANALGAHELAMPEVDGELQPLCAVWRLSVRPAVDDALRAGTTSPKALAARVATRIVPAAELRAADPDLRSLRNVNTPGDYDAARRQAP
jgi:molybdopterin-guanine dinucleotide biosynthesis protein A